MHLNSFPIKNFFFLRRNLSVIILNDWRLGKKKAYGSYIEYSVIEMYDIHSDVNKVDPVCIN